MDDDYVNKTPKELVQEFYKDLHHFLWVCDECTFDQFHNYLLGLTVKWELRKDMLELVEDFDVNEGIPFS